MAGHQDPDAESLTVYAPTPQTETVMTALAIIASKGWKLAVADAKNAFCQSDKLERPKGAIYVEPTDGLNLSEARKGYFLKGCFFKPPFCTYI